MKKTILLTLLIFTLVPLFAQDIRPAANGLSPLDGLLNQGQIDTLYDLTKDVVNETQFAVGLTVDGKDYFFGIKRVNDTLIFVENRDRIFEIGSITKTFTATILAHYVQNGLLDLETPVKDLIPLELKQSALEGKEMRLKHLANHTSGLPRMPDNFGMAAMFNPGGNVFRDYDYTKMAEYLTDNMQLNTPPGTQFTYSNLGAGLLGQILVLQTEKDYETLVQDHILLPLGMAHTAVHMNDTTQKYLVKGRNAYGDTVVNWAFKAMAPAGSILSCTKDMMKYLHKNLTDTTFYALTHQKTFEAREKLSLGLGWLIIQKDQHSFHFHDGGTGGYTSGMGFDKKKQTGVIVLSNLSALNQKMIGRTNKIAFYLLESLY